MLIIKQYCRVFSCQNSDMSLFVEIYKLHVARATPNRSTFATTRISIIRSMHLTRINVGRIGQNHAVTLAWGVTSGERNYGTQ